MHAIPAVMPRALALVLQLLLLRRVTSSQVATAPLPTRCGGRCRCCSTTTQSLARPSSTSHTITPSACLKVGLHCPVPHALPPRRLTAGAGRAAADAQCSHAVKRVAGSGEWQQCAMMRNASQCELSVLVTKSDACSGFEVAALQYGVSSAVSSAVAHAAAGVSFQPARLVRR